MRVSCKLGPELEQLNACTTSTVDRSLLELDHTSSRRNVLARGRSVLFYGLLGMHRYLVSYYM